MPLEKKLPPIRVIIGKDYFNKLVNLTDEKNDFDYPVVKEDKNANLYEKLMKYTFLQDNEQVELRFFPQEASEVILLLLCNLEEKDITKNYYEELIQNRQNYKETKMKESDINE